MSYLVIDAADRAGADELIFAASSLGMPVYFPDTSVGFDPPRVSPKDLLHFTKDHDAGKYPHERYGQAFINHMLNVAIIFPTLFHEVRKDKAIALIHRHFYL